MADGSPWLVRVGAVLVGFEGRTDGAGPGGGCVEGDVNGDLEHGVDGDVRVLRARGRQCGVRLLAVVDSIRLLAHGLVDVALGDVADRARRLGEGRPDAAREPLVTREPAPRPVAGQRVQRPPRGLPRHVRRAYRARRGLICAPAAVHGPGQGPGRPTRRPATGRPERPLRARGVRLSALEGHADLERSGTAVGAALAQIPA